MGPRAMALSLRAPPGAVPHHVGRRAPRSGVLPALGLTALAPRAKQWLRIARGAAKGAVVEAIWVGFEAFCAPAGRPMG